MIASRGTCAVCGGVIDRRPRTGSKYRQFCSGFCACVYERRPARLSQALAYAARVGSLPVDDDRSIGKARAAAWGGTGKATGVLDLDDWTEVLDGLPDRLIARLAL